MHEQHSRIIPPPSSSENHFQPNSLVFSLLCNVDVFNDFRTVWKRLQKDFVKNKFYECCTIEPIRRSGCVTWPPRQSHIIHTMWFCEWIVWECFSCIQARKVLNFSTTPFCRRNVYTQKVFDFSSQYSGIFLWYVAHFVDESWLFHLCLFKRCVFVLINALLSLKFKRKQRWLDELISTSSGHLSGYIVFKTLKVRARAYVDWIVYPCFNVP